jgi:hypothetical protein
MTPITGVEATLADASVALGGRQIAGTWINRRGTAKKMVTKVGASELGGAIGSIAADRATGRSSRVVVDTPEFGRDAYLAVGEEDVAVVRAKQGLMKLKLTDEVIARAARSDVTGAELGGGTLACPLTITFTDGARWEFDVPRGGKSAADRVVASLGS